MPQVKVTFEAPLRGATLEDMRSMATKTLNEFFGADYLSTANLDIRFDIRQVVMEDMTGRFAGLDFEGTVTVRER